MSRPAEAFVLAIDQGTTGTTCLVVDGELRPRGRGYREIRQIFPRPGWVEHDPEEIWESVLAAASDALATAGIRAADLGAVDATDVSNASRTMLLSLATLDWDPELLALFGIPRTVLPEIVPSSGVAGEAELLGARVPIAGIAGDQQAALFGQACFRPGQAKATYGMGSFVLANSGGDSGPAPYGLLRTVAWQLAGAAAVYGLEGSIFVTGAALQWLRDGLGLIADAAESEELARSLS